MKGSKFMDWLCAEDVNKRDQVIVSGIRTQIIFTMINAILLILHVAQMALK